jgi:alkyl hydroperoxide reductase subunit AhpF
MQSKETELKVFGEKLKKECQLKDSINEKLISENSTKIEELLQRIASLSQNQLIFVQDKLKA